MPIIAGFPASNMISPSVRITEQDLSYYGTSITSSNAGIVGFASKGPINTPKLITSKNQLNQTFGYPHPDVGDPYLIYAAEQYLQVAQSLYVVRCAQTSLVSNECAATAFVNLPAAGTLIDIVGSVPQKTPSSGGSSQSATYLNTAQGYQYTFETGVFPGGEAYVRFALNGQISPNLLVIPIPDKAADNIQVQMPATASTSTYPNGYGQPAIGTGIGGSTAVYTADVLAALLNNQLNPEIDGIEFYVSTIGTLEVKTTFAYGPASSLEFIAVKSSACGHVYRPVTAPTPDVIQSNGTITTAGTGVADGSEVYVNVLGLATGNVGVSSSNNPLISGVNHYGSGSYAVPGYWDFSNIANGSLTLNVVVSGTDNAFIDNNQQQFNLYLAASNPAYSTAYNVPLYHMTTTSIAQYIQDQITAASILNGGPGTLGGFIPVAQTNGFLRLDTTTTGEYAQIIVKPTSTVNAIFGFDNLTHQGKTLMTQMGSGVSSNDPTPDYSSYGLVQGGVNTGNTTVSMVLYADSAGIEGNQTVVSVTNNIAESVFSVSVYNNGIQVESWGGLTMDITSGRYVGTYLTLVSSYLSASVTTTGTFGTQAPPANGTYQLTGGNDGIPALPTSQDELLIGNAITYTGMFALSDPEQIDIDYIAVPGHSSTNVITELIDFCQNYRQDCIAIVDPPFGLTVQEIIAWQNGSHPLNQTRFDSDFLALYWPWVKIHDSYNQIDVWVPPSGSIMAVYARNDILSAPWFAPAGETRGIVPGITDVYNRPTLGERDAMYGNHNCINPIVQYSNLTNFVVWGQKTMQRLPTAFDRVNVRRCMFALEKQIRIGSRHMLFDPNDALFDKKFINMCTKILNNIKTARGIYDFIIQADASINTGDVIDRNEFRANIGIQPEKAVEFMFLTFSVNRTGDWTANSQYS